MKNFLKNLGAMLMFLVGTGAAFFAISGALQVWLHMEQFNAIIWSIMPSIIFGAWAAGLLKKD